MLSCSKKSSEYVKIITIVVYFMYCTVFVLTKWFCSCLPLVQVLNKKVDEM